MRIIVSGTANTGKSTFIKDFLKAFPNYKKAEFDYRKLIADATTHSKNTNVDLQIAILNGMLAEISSWDKNADIIMDRGPLDNLVYSMWCNAKGKEGFTDEFIQECLHANALVSQMIDLIFFVPLCPENNIKIVDDGKRETDAEYIEEIDAIFKAIIRGVQNERESPAFFKGQIPGMIELFGNRQSRVEIAKVYLDGTGNIGHGNNEIFNPDKRGEDFLKELDEEDKMAKIQREKKEKQDKYFAYLYEKYNGKKMKGH